MSASSWPYVIPSEAQSAGSPSWASLLLINAEMFAHAPTRNRESIEAFEALSLGFLQRADTDTVIAFANIVADCPDTPHAVLDVLLQTGVRAREIVMSRAPRYGRDRRAVLLASAAGREQLAKSALADAHLASQLLAVHEESVEDALASAPGLDPQSIRELARRGANRPALGALLLKRPDLSPEDQWTLYLSADPVTRARIRSRAPALNRPLPAPADLRPLFGYAGRSDVAGFERELSRAFDLPLATSWRVVVPHRRDLVPLAMKVLGASERDARRAMLFLHPAFAVSDDDLVRLIFVMRDTSATCALTAILHILQAV
jgi:hypothetical protein